MSYTVSGKKITMTRGDSAYIHVTANYKDSEEAYTPVEGDSVAFTVKRFPKDTTIMLTKEVPTDSMVLHLLPEDTKSLQYGEYVFDVQLTYANGDVDTFITDGTLVVTTEVSE